MLTCYSNAERRNDAQSHNWTKQHLVVWTKTVDIRSKVDHPNVASNLAEGPSYPNLEKTAAEHLQYQKIIVSGSVLVAQYIIDKCFHYLF